MSVRFMRCVWAGLGLGAVVSGVCSTACSCSSSSSGGGLPDAGGGGLPDAASSSSSGGLSGSSSTGAGAGGSAPDASPCPPFPRTSAVPSDWEDYPDWSCDCHLFIPGENGTMPPPVEWEPCPALGPTDLGCLWMKVNWNTSEGFHLAITPRFSLDTNTGEPLLLFTRLESANNPDPRYQIVAEVDGPVRTAILETTPANECDLDTDDLTNNRYAFGVNAPAFEGVLVGDIDGTRPKVMLKTPKGQWHSGWGASSEWVARKHAIHTLTSWDEATTVVAYDPSQDPDGMPAHGGLLNHGDYFWAVSVSGYSGIMSWNVVDGARPLVRWYGDWTRGAGMFGTDGTDMVWEYCEGKEPWEDSSAYQDCSIMTAPYTTDPAVALATARRLRSDPGGLWVYPYAVGCGYAARWVHINHNDILIVRLSDGVSWVLYGGDDPQQFSYGHPIGISCEDVFVTALLVPEPMQILRIPLASLGPGIPPD